jgi:hypothetical protein
MPVDVFLLFGPFPPLLFRVDHNSTIFVYLFPVDLFTEYPNRRTDANSKFPCEEVTNRGGEGDESERYKTSSPFDKISYMLTYAFLKTVNHCFPATLHDTTWPRTSKQAITDIPDIIYMAMRRTAIRNDTE